MSCKETCTKYKAIKPPLPKTRYGIGQKRCNSCEIFMDWDGTNCPCCGRLLRTKPRGTKTRDHLMIVRQIKRI
jgi:hypothetical protein